MKKNFLKAGISLAVVTVGMSGAGLSTQVKAVQLADDGLGDVLLFPYYTTLNGMKTFIHVLNTSNKAVVFKIRMRDAKNSRDCRDFNVVLSPEDVWTASIEEGANGLPRIWTADNSCTSPQLPLTDRGGRYIDFTSADYDGRTANGQDSNDTSIDRCREGYIELIEMGASTGGTYYTASLHGASGVPNDCPTIAADLANRNTIAAVSAEFREPENVLKGNFSLIRATTGQGFGGMPTTLANFFTPIVQNGFGVDGFSDDDLISVAGDNKPALSDVNFPVSIVDDIHGTAGVFIRQWNGIDAVSAVLMRSSVINEWSTNAAFGVNTDWVITFPTKRYYADPAISGIVQDPFAELFNAQNDARSCIDVGITLWSREERTKTARDGFSPAEVRDGSQLCFEANVVTFNRGITGQSVLNSQYPQNIEIDDLGNNGWARIDLTASASAQRGISSIVGGAIVSPNIFRGLPVIGFSVFNRSLAATSANYGSLFDHAYERIASDFLF